MQISLLLKHADVIMPIPPFNCFQNQNIHTLSFVFIICFDETGLIDVELCVRTIENNPTNYDRSIGHCVRQEFTM